MKFFVEVYEVISNQATNYLGRHKEKPEIAEIYTFGFLIGTLGKVPTLADPEKGVTKAIEEGV